MVSDMDWNKCPLSSESAPFPVPNSASVNPAYRPPINFPPTRSPVVIQLAKNTKAKPDANTRTLRPDKCLVVSSLAPALRPFHPRNTGANAVTTRIIYARPTIEVQPTDSPAHKASKVVECNKQAKSALSITLSITFLDIM